MSGTMFWREGKRYRVLLADLLDLVGLGIARVPIIYIIRDQLGQVMYIGQTAGGLKARIKQHIRVGTLIGWFIQEHGLTDGWTVEAMVICGDLDAAERHYIQHLQPELNTVMYEAHPESARQTWSSDEVQEVRYDERMRRIVSGKASHAEYQKDTQALDRLYARAYRDPNHPDAEANDNDEDTGQLA